MRNFLQNNYGCVIGILVGVVLGFNPFLIVILGFFGYVYDNNPHKLNMAQKKPKYDATVAGVLEKMFSAK